MFEGLYATAALATFGTYVAVNFCVILAGGRLRTHREIVVAYAVCALVGVLATGALEGNGGPPDYSKAWILIGGASAACLFQMFRLFASRARNLASAY